MLQSSLFVPSHTHEALGWDADEGSNVEQAALAPDTIALAGQYKCMLQIHDPLPYNWVQLLDTTLVEFPPALVPQVTPDQMPAWRRLCKVLLSGLDTLQMIFQCARTQKLVSALQCCPDMLFKMLQLIAGMTQSG